MEMLIVVAIIAVLVTVAIPVLNNNLEKARQAVDMANARSIQAIQATLVNTGESTVFNRQNSQIQKALAAMGSISSRSHSKGRKEGWDWYVVEYDYDHKTGEVRDYIYSGFSGDRSGIQTVTRGSTNIAVAMSRKKK